jgi:hypothetical protein
LRTYGTITVWDTRTRNDSESFSAHGSLDVSRSSTLESIVFGAGLRTDSNSTTSTLMSRCPTTSGRGLIYEGTRN